MKAVIFAGGFGSRLLEETSVKPKPLVEIGGKPILLHIMNIYSNYGVKDFIILVGYKGHLIKEYFMNYMSHVQDVCIDVASGKVDFIDGTGIRPDWKISVIDTGETTMTGGRLKRIQHVLKDEPYFALTYGDGVCDIDINQLVEYHKQHGKIGTVSAVLPPGRFGALDIIEGQVKQFVEKPVGDGAFINGGFFIMSPGVFDYLTDDKCVFEQEPLQGLARDGELSAYVHKGFSQCMDTLRDKNYLEGLLADGTAPWVNQEVKRYG